MKRVSQLAECCGSHYWRWRLPGKPFPAGHTICCKCALPLDWSPSPGTAKATSLRYYHNRKARFNSQGLNSRGLPYGRHPNIVARNRPAHLRRLSRENQQRRAQRFVSLGLNTRGQPRRINLLGHPANPLEQAWRQLRAEMPTRDGADFLSPLERSEI